MIHDDPVKDGKNSPDNWYDAWQKENRAEQVTEETSLAESTLFSEAMQGVQPLKQDNKVRRKPAPKTVKIRNHDEGPDINDVFSDAPVDECPEQLLYSRDGITPDTLKKLRKGKFHINNSIDLHGMTVDAARNYLLEFLAECETDGSRCIIIVHGKGYSSPGKKPVIKPMVNRWLRATPMVLAFCSAQAKDGGTGAVYVLLKRNR
ncbi:MAG: Smr/MutS family protein [Gammaproteobacteria bacterium]|nr:Smr/MutS family protein [Gammaproteobacteria bacterium]